VKSPRQILRRAAAGLRSVGPWHLGLAVGLAAGCSPARSVAPRAAAPPPAVRPEEVLSQAGIVMDPARIPGFGVRIWFPDGASRHAGALALLYTARSRQPQRVALLGVLGKPDARMIRMGRALNMHRPYPVILVNNKESHLIQDERGSRRSVRFRGREGRDYSLEDLRRVLVQEFARSHPGQALDLD